MDLYSVTRLRLRPRVNGGRKSFGFKTGVLTLRWERPSIITAWSAALVAIGLISGRGEFVRGYRFEA